MAAVLSIKTALKAAGWTVPRSSDGSTLNAAGDQITHAAAGANGLANTKAWFVLRQPGPFLGNQREICFQYTGLTGDVNYWRQWRTKYSRGAGFTGGSATVTAAAADETVIHGTGTNAAPVGGSGFVTNSANFGITVPQRQHFVCNDAAPYEWFGFCHPQGGGAPSMFLMCDALAPGSFEVDDVDPYVFSFDDPTAAYPTVSLWGWFRAGLSLAAWVNFEAITYRIGATDWAANAGTNPFTGKDMLLPMFYGRNASIGSVGWKGQSGLVRLASVSRPCGDTLSIATTSDAICISGTRPAAFPWDGSTPIV